MVSSRRAVEVSDTVPDKPVEGSGAVVPRRSLTIALECDRPAAGGLGISLDHFDEVIIGRGVERSAEAKGRVLFLKLPGRAISATHARLARERHEWVAHDLRSTNGLTIDGKPSSQRKLQPGNVISLGHTLFLFSAGIFAAGAGAREAVVSPREVPGAGLSTLTPYFEEELRALPRLAGSPLPVLVLGETGTGKELVARAIHQLSRRSGRMIAVNCAAIPGTLVESELFGHRKGAFSGALRDEPGLVRSADQGTLLLDEIGDLPLPAQGALLRVLQEREVMPVGATRPCKVEVRVVCATHRNLQKMVEAGTFRADLLARLEGAVVRLPPLRERMADLGVLIPVLMRRSAGDRAQRISFEARAGLALALHTWPGNVRELEQALGRAVAMADDEIRLEHLPEPVAAALDRCAQAGQTTRLPPKDLRAVLDAQLRANAGNVAAVARSLGKAPAQMYRWMRRFGLNPDDYRVEL